VAEKIALHTRLRLGAELAYEAVHAEIPRELDSALRTAGMRSWKIWRDGQDLFHVVDVDDFARMGEILRDDPADIAWQERISAFVEPTTIAGGPLLPVWSLPLRGSR